MNEEFFYEATDTESLPPRKITHSKKKKKNKKGRLKQKPKHAKQRTSFILKEIPNAKNQKGKTKSKNKKNRNPFILIRMVLTLFMVMMIGLLTYITWVWFQG